MIKLNIEYGNKSAVTPRNAGNIYVTKHGLLFTDKASVVMATLAEQTYDTLVINLHEPLQIYQMSEIRHFGKHLEAVVNYYREEDRELKVVLYLPFQMALPAVQSNGSPMIPLIPRDSYMVDLTIFDEVRIGKQVVTEIVQDHGQIYLDIVEFFRTPLDFIRDIGVKQPINRVVCADVVQYSIMDSFNNIWRFDVPKMALPADPEKYQSVTRVFEYSQPWGTIVSEVL